MRRKTQYTTLISVGLTALAACGPNGGLLEGGGVLGIVVSGQQAADPAALGGGGVQAEPAALGADPATSFISGTVVGRDDYRLFELSGLNAGEQLTLEEAQFTNSRSLFTVAVFDQDMNLLDRTPSFPVENISYIMRRTAATVVVGVKPTYDDSGGGFRVRIRRESGRSIPGASRQVVYLNFGSGTNIKVHTRTGITFAPFNAARLGDAYVGTTAEVKSSIVSTMRQDYARYDVRIVTSDEGPPPAGAYSTVHFGGDVPGLLGLADNVDRYNRDATQTAVVFIEGFAPFEVMQLTPEEMGVMIGNVGSHELGHMLGLYHTREPHNIMDTTGTAWDLAANQRFDRALLEASVFPVGAEDSPMILADTVGELPGAPPLEPQVNVVKPDVRMLIRDLTEIELRHRCGLCDSPGL